LYLEAQPQVVINFGPKYDTASPPQNTTPVINIPGDRSKNLVPWNRITSQRGNKTDIIVMFTPGDDNTNAYNRGLIEVKRPGVYLINGFLQLTGVSQTDDWQEISLLINKGTGSGIQTGDTFYQASKLSSVKDGGISFTCLVNITEEMINEEDLGEKKKFKGVAYLQPNIARQGNSSNVYFTNDDERFHWCSVTHSGSLI
jgi:hypothetical protein